MKKLLNFYLWQFVLVYIDDIIIYSQTLKQHISHLDQVLIMLENNEVTLTFFKCHFVYFNIKALNHHVSRFKLSILSEKIKVIRKMKFSRNLRKLKIELNFFEYYRIFVDYYVAIARSLMRLKTRNFKESSVKDRFRKKHVIRMRLHEKVKIRKTFKNEDLKLDANEKCYRVWKQLKKALCDALILIYLDFNKLFILYVNESKEKKYKIAMHQLNKDEVKKFVLFLSRDLNDAKIKYWTTKLKIETLIWILIKLLQYFDDDNFTIVTDHTALKAILQNKIIDRRSTRLNEWIMYLSTYLFRMNIIYKFEKSHNNVDGLSRIFINYIDAYAYSVITITANDEFLIEFKDVLIIDSHFY